MSRSVKGILLGILIALPITIFLGLGFRGQNSTIRSPLVGHRAPNFSLATLQGGGTISLAALRGHPVVLNFWQSTCIPCRQEHPYLVSAWHTYRARGVQFVGVSYEDARTDALAFIHTYGVGWPTVADPGDGVAINYGVYGIPETFFIDRRGVIRAKSVGPVTPDVLDRQIGNLLGGAA